MAVLVRAADRLGIERLLLSQGYSANFHPTADQLREENDRVLRAVRRFPDRAYGSVTFLMAVSYRISLGLQDWRQEPAKVSAQDELFC